MKFKKFKFENYNLDNLEKYKKKFYSLSEEIKNLENTYNEEIKSLNIEIELLPKSEKEKKEKIKELKKGFNEKIEYITKKFKKKLPVFIVIEDKYFPIKSEELIKIYSIIADKVFRKDKILFLTKKDFFEIANFLDFCEMKEYFNKIIDAIFLKIEKKYLFKEDNLEKFCNIKFIN